ncbi:MAG: SPOR domain-containing protein [Caulobacterales bacterium]|nr:SPOR domain-containing protein [Caulobacterales bacterium]
MRVRYLGAAPAEQTRPVSVPARRRAESEELFVQVGSYLDRRRADKIRRSIGTPAKVERAVVDGRRYNRVIVGPWPGEREAEEARRAMASLGFTEAKIFSAD